MALTVGVNTYITLDDATTYISSNYTSSESVSWNALSEEDREVLLRKACSKIDSQRLTGKKVDTKQVLQFPRSVYSCSQGSYVDQKVPAAVQNAQVEEALALAKGTPKRLELQQQGVRAFRLGDLSEEYRDPDGNTLISTVAKQLLRSWLLGGAPIV